MDIGKNNAFLRKIRKEIIALETHFNKLYPKFEKVILQFLALERKRLKQNPFLVSLTLRDWTYNLIKQKERNINKVQKMVFLLNKDFYKLNSVIIQYKGSFVSFLPKKNISDLVFHEIKKIEVLNIELMKLLEFFESMTYTDLVHKKVEFNNIISEIKSIIGFIESSIRKYETYKYSLNIESYKKITYHELKFGDIILLQRKNMKNSNYFVRIINRILKSPIIHSSLIYKIEDNKVFVFEANAYNFRRTEINLLELKKGTIYFVLRLKKPIPLIQKKELKELMEGSINLRYSFLKLVGYMFRANSNNLVKRLKNPFRKLKGVFCSEIIALIFSRIGVKVVETEDINTVTPVDFINTSSLEVIGYMGK
ncbi:MAG: hypothetical protein ACOCXG_03235 [Nanoarchaeota archaeon]